VRSIIIYTIIYITFFYHSSRDKLFPVLAVILLFPVVGRFRNYCLWNRHGRFS